MKTRKMQGAVADCSSHSLVSLQDCPNTNHNPKVRKQDLNEV